MSCKNHESSRLLCYSIDLINELTNRTLDNENFNVCQFSRMDAERLRCIADLIDNELDTLPGETSTRIKHES